MSMMENGPESALAGAVNEVWLEEARNLMRASIVTNLKLIASGYFSNEELEFVQTTEDLPHVFIEDPALRDIMDRDDTDAYNEYIASHPEVISDLSAEDRLMRARTALADQQAIYAHEELTLDEAIEAVLIERSPEIEEDARLHQALLEAAAKHGFAI